MPTNELLEQAADYYYAQQYAQAVALFKKAAEQGYAAVQYNLAACYAKGEGVSPDYKQATYWIEKAAEQGDAIQSFCSPFFGERGLN